jgi:hypothetical protein
VLNKYISAIWADMVARMSGLASLVFTFLGVYSRWFEGVNGGQYAKEFFYVVAILCFLFANYRIWADEHKKVGSTLPDFSLMIEQMRWELNKDNNTALVFAVFMLNIRCAIGRSWLGRLLHRGRS